MNPIPLLAFALAVTGCTPNRTPPPVFHGHTYASALSEAARHALRVGGHTLVISSSGSMEPLITGGDVVVVSPIDYINIKVGMVANYQARWLGPDNPTVVHYVSAKQGDEWIMDGMANANYERGGMGRKEFIGQVVGIYTQRNKP